MTDAYVFGGVRNSFARYGGWLSHIRADDLLGMTMKGGCGCVGIADHSHSSDGNHTVNARVFVNHDAMSAS